MFHARALMHAAAFLSAAHTSVRVFRFGASLPSSSATWGAAQSQSGCLSFRQPAHQTVAPKCHGPSLCGPPVLRRAARRNRIAQTQAHQAKSPEIKSRERGHARAKHHRQHTKGLLVRARFGTCPQPNWAVKRTPTRAKASPLSWPLLVPCAPSVLRCRLPWALGPNSCNTTMVRLLLLAIS